MSDWAASGGLWLTGWPDGPPRWPVGDPLGLATRLAARVSQAAGDRGGQVAIDPAVCLFGRAALLDLARGGRVSAGGACRLVATADGWAAVNLARPDDVELLPALFGVEVSDEDPWPAVECEAGRWSTAALVDAAGPLGLPVSGLRTASRPGVRREQIGPRRPPGGPVGLVVDLSAMWAGPLCTHLLTASGAEVVKVESASRPDGLRHGDPRFYDWLHHGQRSVLLDWGTDQGRQQLRALLSAADVVVDASRPRVLAQLGIDLTDLVTARGATWLSITGHGRHGAAGDRVAFGDDAAVAGGLVAFDDRGTPVFCADAIADPLTGLAAAAAVFDALDAGGGERVEVVMAGVAAHAASLPAPEPHAGDALPPTPPPAAPPAPAAGADTDAVLGSLEGVG